MLEGSESSDRSCAGPATGPPVHDTTKSVGGYTILFSEATGRSHTHSTADPRNGDSTAEPAPALASSHVSTAGPDSVKTARSSHSGVNAPFFVIDNQLSAEFGMPGLVLRRRRQRH